MQNHYAPSNIASITSLSSSTIAAEHGTLTATERAAFDRIRQRIEASKRLESFRSSYGNFGSDIEASFLTDDSLESVFNSGVNPVRRIPEGQDEVQSTSTVESSDLADQIAKETTRITDLLITAQSDTLIWTILETEVFAQVRAFLAQLQAEERASSKKGKKRTNKKTVYQASASNPDSTLLPTLQATYSFHILTAARLLRLHFPRSTYTSSILPSIKALGPISYVLGASTELYNELLYIRWIYWRDPYGCAELVSEMHDRGVEPDGKTLAVFKYAERERVSARQLWARLSKDKVVSQWGKQPEKVKVGKQDLSVTQASWWFLQGVKSGWARWRVVQAETIARLREQQERTQMETEAFEMAEDFEDFNIDEVLDDSPPIEETSKLDQIEPAPSVDQANQIGSIAVNAQPVSH